MGCAGGTTSSPTSSASIPTNPTPRPAELKVISVTTPQFTVSATSPISVNVNLTNTGEVSGTFPVILQVSGKDFQTQNVTLSGGETRIISFTVPLMKQGDYSLSVGNVSTIVTATPISVSIAVIKQGDLPYTYQPISAQDLGMDPNEMAGLFDGNTTIDDFYAFASTQTVTNFGLVFGFNIYPLTLVDQLSYDLELSNPATLAASFIQGMGLGSSSKTEILPSFNKIGDKSLGFRAYVPQQGFTMIVDFATMRNQDVVTMVILMSLDGYNPGTSCDALVQTLQSRLSMVMSTR